MKDNSYTRLQNLQKKKKNNKIKKRLFAQYIRNHTSSLHSHPLQQYQVYQ